MPEVSSGRQEFPGVARSCKGLSGFASGCQRMSEDARMCQDVPGCARMCPIPYKELSPHLSMILERTHLLLLAALALIL